MKTSWSVFSLVSLALLLLAEGRPYVLDGNKASDRYNVFDMHSVRYREILETMFRDAEMQAALK